MTTIINDIMNAARNKKDARRSLERQVKAVNDNVLTIKRRAGKLYELPPINLIQLIPFFGLAVLKSPDYIATIFRDNESIADFFEKQGATHLSHSSRVICSLLGRSNKSFIYKLSADETSPFGVTVTEFYSVVDTISLELPPNVDRETFFKTRKMIEGRWMQLQFSDKINFDGVSEEVKEQIVVSNALITMFILMLSTGKPVTTEMTHAFNYQKVLAPLEVPAAPEGLFEVKPTFEIPVEWDEVFSGDLDLDKIYYRAKQALIKRGTLPQ